MFNKARLEQIVVEGLAYDLRPVTEDDAGLIVRLRTGDPQRAKFLSPVAADEQKQRAWLRSHFEKDDEVYWVIERKLPARRSEGLASIYRVDREKNEAEWGRWILEAGSLGAIESALLVYRAAFEIMELDSVYCITAIGNEPVLSFHDQCGLAREAVMPNQLLLPGGLSDGVRHRCLKSNWPAVRTKLEAQAAMIAKVLRRKPTA